MVIGEYTFYSSGFFGYGEKGDFTYWSAAHFLPILLLISAVVALYYLRGRLREWRHEENLRFALGFILLIVEMSYYWRLLYVGSGNADKRTLMTNLPLQVCQWTCILAAFMLMKKSSFLYGLCYYISLTAGLIPMITPAVITTTGPTYYRYYQFWLEHGLPVFAVCYMTFVHGFRPSWKKAWQPYTFLWMLAALSIYANGKVAGANYLYLATSTDGDSIANLLPENMCLRVALYAGTMAVLFGLAYLPVFLSEGRKRERIGKE